MQAGQWTGELRQLDRAGMERRIMARQQLIRTATGEPQAIISYNTDRGETPSRGALAGCTRCTPPRCLPGASPMS